MCQHAAEHATASEKTGGARSGPRRRASARRTVEPLLRGGDELAASNARSTIASLRLGCAEDTAVVRLDLRGVSQRIYSCFSFSTIPSSLRASVRALRCFRRGAIRSNRALFRTASPPHGSQRCPRAANRSTWRSRPRSARPRPPRCVSYHIVPEITPIRHSDDPSRLGRIADSLCVTPAPRGGVREV